MTKNKLNNEYFDWMCKLVSDSRYFEGLSCQKLLSFLHSVNFNYSIAMDENREEDGIDLRYRFGYENSYEQSIISTYLDNRPCSVLEMMIALAIRCEEHIMDDPDIGDRTSQWFWSMIENLGLGSMTDTKFNKKYANTVIERFLNREYEPNGKGSLFTVRNSHRDMRTVEKWYQMCWYLDEIV